MSCLVLCSHPDAQVVVRLAEALRGLAGGVLEFESFDAGEALLARAREARRAGDDVPLVFCCLGLAAIHGSDLFGQFDRDPLLRGARKVLLDRPDDREAVDALLQRGLMQARLDPGFGTGRLQHLLQRQLTDYVVHTAPHLIDDLDGLLDLSALAGAFSSAKENLERLSSRLNEVQHSVIGVDKMTDAKVEEAMIEEFDRILNRPGRRTYSPGEIIVNEGDDPGTIWIILRGRVKLFRTIDGEDVTFHSESAGRIVGLMSLSLQNPVFFSCRAATEVRALVLTRGEVREAIHRSPGLSNYLITVILRSMARRNRRATQLLVQVRSLNAKLERQRDELSATLEELKATQERLVDSAKMATLGQLAAGMAHELNNPVGAMMSATTHLGRDLERLLAAAPGLETAARTIPVARSSQPLSTRDERRLRDELARTLNLDPAQAARLVAAGVHGASQFEDLAGRAGRARAVDEIALAGQIGVALRNLSNCGGRIADLVRSLKAYAREDERFTDGVELNGTIEDVLLLLGNQLKRVELRKEYDPSVPPLRANPSQLQQVWTNLISNALQALEGSGSIVVRTSSPRESRVRVEVEDDGPGVPREVRERLFDPRFTTRAGRVEFGLGMGLPIARSIVRRHGGELGFESRPGRTVFRVDLPVDPPPVVS